MAKREMKSTSESPKLMKSKGKGLTTICLFGTSHFLFNVHSHHLCSRNLYARVKGPNG